MNKKPTSTLFWAKHLGLALAVIIVAGIVIHLQMNMTSAPKPVDAPEERSVAKGLSDFYREFRMTASEPERHLDQFFLGMEFGKVYDPWEDQKLCVSLFS